MTTIRELVAATRVFDTTPICHALPGLTWHVLNPLHDAEIDTLELLAEQTDDDLLALPGFGKGRLAKLRAELERVAQEQPTST